MTTDASARLPIIRPAIDALKAYRVAHTSEFNTDQTLLIEELDRRLERLHADCGRLISINNRLLELETPHFHVDASGALVAIIAGESIALPFRAKDGGPIIPIQAGAFKSYHPGRPNPMDRDESADLKLQMESLLEQFYYSAFRITKGLQALLGNKRDCRPLTMVRNQLIEHHQDGDDYSFGFSTNGPVVRPAKRSAETWCDEGLVKNAEALARHIAKAFSLTQPST